MSMLASGASGFAGLCAASVLRLWQFVGGVVNHVVLRMRGSVGDLEADEASGKHDDSNQQQRFEHPTREHAAIGEDADGRFSGEGFGRARKGGTERGLEFFPARRPFNQQMRRVGPPVIGPLIDALRDEVDVAHTIAGYSVTCSAGAFFESRCGLTRISTS